MTTGRAAAYQSALAAVLPDAEHQAGKLVQQRLRPMRGFKSLAGARTLCRGHGLVRNLAGGHYRLGLVCRPPA